MVSATEHSNKWYGAITANVLSSAGPALLFGLRLWLSVCFALYVAFWLELDDPFWAGTSAAIVCQPQLGASLRKAWFRMIGTIVGAIMTVVLTAFFPQDRIAFLGGLALWGGVCAFAASILRNFASYAAALAGYTAAIIAADTLGAVGGANSDVFMLAITRASEICIGIVCAGIVLAGTDLGGAPRQLAVSFANLAAQITDQFAEMVSRAGPKLPDTEAIRRDISRRAIALDPFIDQALGESPQLRYRSSVVQVAFYGLFDALISWRAVASLLGRLPDSAARKESNTILRKLPVELRLTLGSASQVHWTADPIALGEACDTAMRTLLASPARTPSLRLLADKTAALLAGLSHVLDGVALLIGAPGQSYSRKNGLQFHVPDWMPAFVNAGRAFVVIAAVEFFWIGTAWPGGTLAIVFVAVVVLLLSPRAEQAYGAAILLTFGVAISVVLAAIAEFAVLPSVSTFTGFAIAIGLFLVPVGFGMVYSRRPKVVAVLTGIALVFMPLLAPTNQMNYDTAQYYNSALAIFAGCVAALLSFRLLPPLSPEMRTSRLLALSLRDLRRLASEPCAHRTDDWKQRLYSRVSALPDQAEPAQRARLLAALSVGIDVIELSRTAQQINFGVALDTALAPLAQGDSAIAMSRLAALDYNLASPADAKLRVGDLAMKARASILAITQVLAQNSGYFDAGSAK
jgi:uncharacterized membrane protein YccC